MIIGKIVGNVWATKKDEGLNGVKLLVVEPLDVLRNQEKSPIVAADIVGAGVGELVLVIQGGSARYAAKNTAGYPVDAVIVGIIDDIDIPK